jgi:hypothetical protein
MVLKPCWRVICAGLAGYGGSGPSPPSRSIPERTTSFAHDGSAQITSPHEIGSDVVVDWKGIRASLLELGLTIESRRSASPILALTRDCAVVEIRDELGKVLSEGNPKRGDDR